MRWGLYALTCAVLGFWILTEYREVEYRCVLHSRCILILKAREGKVLATATHGPQPDIWQKSSQMEEDSYSLHSPKKGLQLMRFSSNHDLHEKLGLILPNLDYSTGHRVAPPLKLRNDLVPVWIFFAPLFLLCSLCVVRAAKKYKKGHCYFCGYSLTANTSGRCPECGNRIAKGVARFGQPFVVIRSFFLAPRRTWMTRLGIIAALLIALNLAYCYFEDSNCYKWTCSDCGVRIETLTSSPMKRVFSLDVGYYHMNLHQDHHWRFDWPWMRYWMFWSWARRWTDQAPSIETILKSDPAEFKLGRGGMMVANFDVGPLGELMRKAWPQYELRSSPFKR